MKLLRLTICACLLLPGARLFALEPVAVLTPTEFVGYPDYYPYYAIGFGAAADISGDYIVAGAPGYPSREVVSGAVYVFRRRSRAWIEQAKLVPSDLQPLDNFGISVAIDGDLIVAGAPRYDSLNLLGSGPGAVYVFRRDQNGTPDDPADDTWPQEARLTVPHPQLGEAFGRSVAVSGDVIVAGEPEFGDTTEVFRWRPGTPGEWVHEQTLTGSLPGRLAFGFSVGIDRDRIVVGEYYTPGSETGAAYVFAPCLDGSGWVEQDILIPNDHSTSDSFGWCVSVRGDQIAVGAPGINSAYVFQRQDDTWVQQPRLTIPDTASGRPAERIAIDGDLLLVDGDGDDEVAAHLFRRDENGWSESVTLVYPELGYALAIDGPFAVVYRHVYALRDQRSLQHYAPFQACFSGPTPCELSPTCRPFDLDGDGRVDLADFEKFVGTFVGP